MPLVSASNPESCFESGILGLPLLGLEELQSHGTQVQGKTMPYISANYWAPLAHGQVRDGF